MLHAPRLCIFCPEQLKVDCLVASSVQSQGSHQYKQLQNTLRCYDVNLQSMQGIGPEGNELHFAGSLELSALQHAPRLRMVYPQLTAW